MLKQNEYKKPCFSSWVYLLYLFIYFNDSGARLRKMYHFGCWWCVKNKKRTHEWKWPFSERKRWCHRHHLGQGRGNHGNQTQNKPIRGDVSLFSSPGSWRLSGVRDNRGHSLCLHEGSFPPVRRIFPLSGESSSLVPSQHLLPSMQWDMIQTCNSNITRRAHRCVIKSRIVVKTD